LWLLGFFSTSAMNNIPVPFTIEIDGKPIAKADVGAKDHTQAKLGQEPAVFTLANGRLQNGDWIMGRDFTENRSFLPKKVSWYEANAENELRVQPVLAKKEANNYQLIFTSMFEVSTYRRVHADKK
jgi:hypothetical protein